MGRLYFDFSDEELNKITKAAKFENFLRRIREELLNHSVIIDNSYTKWFAGGTMSENQVRAFVVQFSVFSNLFLEAQLKKANNADSLEGRRASLEILANEIGVVFNRGSENKTAEGESGVDPELVGTEGTVEGGVFRFRAGHFEWLLQIAKTLGLGFNEIGKRRHGTEATLIFCDELGRLYGNEDYQISQAASYAIENWAAAGFWKELIAGLEKFNERTGLNLPLAFFQFHDRLEAQHAKHTQEELKEYYFSHTVDEDEFIRHGKDMLKACAVFWNGLNEDRLKLETQT